MAGQETIFLNGEANAWWHRNKDKSRDDEVLKELLALNIKPSSVIEYGASNGWRLWGLKKAFNCVCVGVEPSRDAIAAGKQRHPGIALERGNAALGYPGQYDLVIYGFCLYVCDPASLFKVAAMGDANVRDGGYLVIHDFDPDYPHKVPYHHDPEVFSWKMKYSQLWLANPAYRLVKKAAYHDGTAVWILKKDIVAGWPEEAL